MKKRWLVGKDGQLLDKDGNVLGRLVSMTVDIDPEPDTLREPGGFGGEEGLTPQLPESSSDVVETSTPQGGVGGSQTGLFGRTEPGYPTGAAGEATDAAEALNPHIENFADALSMPAKVAVVWAHYQKVIPSGTRYKLDEKRRTIIRNALKVRPLEQVFRAIDGLAVSPHHNGQNESRKKFLGIHYALKGIGAESNDERIDKMAAKAGFRNDITEPQGNSRPGMMDIFEFARSLPSASRETFWGHVANIVKWAESPDHKLHEANGRASEVHLRGAHNVAVVIRDGKARGLRRLPRDPTNTSR
jgi:hypothetical protein